ncbi:3923_t:CDS:2 [Acaulospora colombiana]|uniref:3923_t:CDS:1 n=1 Tax=Acaulospora colombiana TaxID=27376 RepID=A0ACA9P0Q0_9GLOM|nr:3923_t:CDS:2 [Acaulospora colombiana]
MNASAVAATPPAISNTTPKSHVRRDTTHTLVIGSLKTFVLTQHGTKQDSRSKNDMAFPVPWLRSIETNNSSGNVVNIFIPKQNRATLINVSS